jgi:inositol phosphorylceramide mannosyltransferase catalytic subunit
MSIPKIIHQIWIGPKKLPSIYLDTWKNDYIGMFPEYEYVFWDDIKIDKLDMDERIRRIYNFEDTYFGKADIARYVIMEKYGGIYIDADSVWMNNKCLDKLIEKSKTTNYFASWEPLCSPEEKRTPRMSNGVFGCTPHHPNSKFLVDELISLEPRYEQIRKKNSPWKVTGPMLITKLFHQPDLKLTILPSVYFYPIRWHGITDPELHKKIDVSKDSYMFQYGISSNNLKY